MNRAYLVWNTGEQTAEILCEACWSHDGKTAWNQTTVYLGDDVPSDWLCYHRTSKPYTVQFTDRYHYEGQPSQKVSA